MRAPAERTFQVDGLIAPADYVAVAALRELPEALVLLFDGDLRFVVAAGQAIDRLGERSALREGEPVQAAFPDGVWKLIEPLFRSALDGETRSREIWTAGRRRCLMVDAGPLSTSGSGGEDGGGASAGGMAVILDITARRQADLLSREPLGGFEEVFEQAPIGTGLLDRDGRWLLVNRALCEITGYTNDELIGKRFDGIMHPDDASNDDEQRQQLLAGQIPAFQVEKRYFDASGETVSAIVAMSLVRNHDGAPLHFIAQLQDISERKQLEEHLRRLADHDPRTGLRNRRLFEHDLKLQVARSQRYGEVAGLMVIDVDAFEDTIHSYGHEVGEETLKAVARALVRRLRQTDLVARLSGGEFAVLLPHIDEEGVAVVAEGLGRVVQACSIDVGEGVLHPRVSIGYVLITEGTESAEKALTDAERATPGMLS